MKKALFIILVGTLLYGCGDPNYSRDFEQRPATGDQAEVRPGVEPRPVDYSAVRTGIATEEPRERDAYFQEEETR